MHQRLDPFFRVETAIGSAEATNGGPSTAPALRASAIRDAAYRVRDTLFASYDRVTSESAEMLPLQEQTSLLMAAFSDRPRTLAPFLDDELSSAIAEFRALVPLVPFTKLDQLCSSAPAQVGREVASLLSDFSSGKLSADDVVETARELAVRAGVAFDENLDLATAIQALARDVSTAASQDTMLTEFAQGTESRVYLSAANRSVYKVVPFRGELLQISPVLNDDPITLSNDAGTYLADQHGRMPLFERALLLAQTPGVCRTELVAITASGMAVLKQPYLGEIEPSESQVEEWVTLSGHVSLPAQPTENEGLGVPDDSARTPFIAAHPAQDGRVVIGLDLNPRNSRSWNGRCVPFDPVLRELHPEEIQSNRALAQAVEQLQPMRSVQDLDI